MSNFYDVQWGDLRRLQEEIAKEREKEVEKLRVSLGDLEQRVAALEAAKAQEGGVS